MARPRRGMAWTGRRSRRRRRARSGLRRSRSGCRRRPPGAGGRARCSARGPAPHSPSRRACRRACRSSCGRRRPGRRPARGPCGRWAGPAGSAGPSRPGRPPPAPCAPRPRGRLAVADPQAPARATWPRPSSARTPRAAHGHRLERLGGGAEVDDQIGVAGAGQQPPVGVGHRDRAQVPALHEPGPLDLGQDLHGRLLRKRSRRHPAVTRPRARAPRRGSVADSGNGVRRAVHRPGAGTRAGRGGRGRWR